MFGLAADLDGCANDLVANDTLWRGVQYWLKQTMRDADRVERGTPATPKRVQVRAADAAMGDFDVDVRLLPRLGLILLELQVALRGLWVKAHPALELVIGTHVFD